MARLASTLLQTSDSSLRHTRRIAQYMQKVKLRRVVKPNIPEENEVPLDTHMQASAVPGRAVSAEKVGKDETKGHYKFFFHDNGTQKVFKVKKPSVTADFKILPKETSADTVAEVHEELARLFNAWPWTFIPEGNKHAQVPAPLWISRILTKIRSRRPVIQAVGLHGPLYSIKIKYIDPATGQMAAKPCRVSPSNATMASVQVPTLPPMTLVDYESKSNPKDGTHYIGATSLDASETSTASQHRAQDALKWIALQLQGVVATDARMDQLIGFQKAQLGIPNKDWYHGIYGNEGALYLFSRYSKERTTKVGPSAPLAGDLKGITKHEMQLSIHSLNASRCTPVAETIVQLFTEGEDIRRVWLEAARTADQVNLAIAEGVPPVSQCDCSDDSASSELHPCEGCGNPTMCFKRTQDSRGRLVCSFCDYEDRTHPAAVRNANETGAQYRLRVALSANFRRECRVRGSDPDSAGNQSILQKATDDILSQLDKTNKTGFTDQYTGKRHDLGLSQGLAGKNPSRRRYVPWMLCPDAAFPEGQPEVNGIKHSAGNLETTSVVCNMAKYIHLPGVLHVIAEFLCGEKSPEARAKLLRCLSGLTLARLKHRFMRKSNKMSVRERFDKAMQEMIRGELIGGESGPWEEYSQRYVAHPQPAYDVDQGNNLWEDEVYDRLQSCAQSIADYFGVKPAKLDDKTIWFGDKNSNPKDLDRNGVFQLLRERLARMRLECNKKWITYDNEETLYAEIIFQDCATRTKKPELQSLKQKYGDRLGLPLTSFINSPLKFSVAHRTHGYGMLTGWPTANPLNVSERIDNDDKNNMLIESWYVNSAKQDMAEDYYDDLDQILRSCHLSTTRYNPNGSLPQGSGQTFVGSFDELENEDEFMGEDFNANAFKEGGAAPTPVAPVAPTVTGDGEEAATSQAGEEEPSAEPGSRRAVIRLDPNESMYDSIKRIRTWIGKDDKAAQRFADDPEIMIRLAEAHKCATEDDFDRFKRARDVALMKLGYRFS